MADDVKQTILNTISDSVSDLLYYDRKEDESLPRGAIERALADGTITLQEMIDAFASELRKGIDGG